MFSLMPTLPSAIRPDGRLQGTGIIDEVKIAFGLIGAERDTETR